MTLIVTSTTDDTISMPGWLMNALGLKDGAMVKASVEGESLSLSPLAEFLALRGAMRDDEEFNSAIEALDEQWQSWTNDLSA